MSISLDRWLAALATSLALAGAAQGQGIYPGIGRAATASEVAAWDIDVRPDFKGLPPGSGSVARGMEVWEAKCASCHGVFGESNQVFSPLIGGTTAADVSSGHVARLNDPAYPGRTTLMKLASLSTLWDYIRRAMPWNEPKSLAVDEVYAVTAFLLNLGGVVPDDFTLSDRNVAAVQQRLPNRLGLSSDHGLWPGRSFGNGGRPDVKAVPCMRNCRVKPTLASSMPDYARGQHGNLAEQNRSVGAQRGIDTGGPSDNPRASAPHPAPPAAAWSVAKQNNCLTCHALDQKIVGPALRDVARRYAGRGDAEDYLAQKMRTGSTGQWGPIPMPAQNLSDDDAKVIARWLATGAKQ